MKSVKACGCARGFAMPYASGRGGAFTGRFFHAAAIEAAEEPSSFIFFPALPWPVLFFFFFFFFLGLAFLRGGRVVGQGSGMKRPKSKGSPCSKATKMSCKPRAKQLCGRGRDRLVARR